MGGLNENELGRGVRLPNRLQNEKKEGRIGKLGMRNTVDMASSYTRETTDRKRESKTEEDLPATLSGRVPFMGALYRPALGKEKNYQDESMATRSS